MPVSRFNAGQPRDGAPQGAIQFSNGDWGLAVQLCSLDPKLLDIVGSDLVNDWGRYCEISGPPELQPDPSPGCQVTQYEYVFSVKCEVYSLFGSPSETSVRDFVINGTYLDSYVGPLFEVKENFFGRLSVYQPVFIGSECSPLVGENYNIEEGNSYGNEWFINKILNVTMGMEFPFQTFKCCPDIFVPKLSDYIRRGTYTRSEWIKNVLPEIVRALLPDPFRLGRGAFRGLGGSIDDMIGFTPRKTPTIPGRPRPGKPLPTRELPSRRPRPAPSPARPPAPKPGRPLPFPRRKPAPTPVPVPPPVRRPQSPPPPVRPPSPLPAPQPLPRIPGLPRTPTTPRPRVRPPSVPRPSTTPQRPPLKVPGPVPWRPSRPRPVGPKPTPSPTPTRRPSPTPTRRPSPSPAPVRRPGRPPSPLPNRPGQPRPPAEPAPPARRPYRPPSPLPPWRPPSPLPKPPRQPPYPPEPRVPNPSPITQPVPNGPPLPQSPAPWWPSETVVQPRPELNLEREPQVPIQREPCSPCPEIVVVRNIPVMIPGPQGPPGKDGEKGEDGNGGDMAVLISTKSDSPVFAQTLDFTGSVVGKTSGTLPRNISRVVLRYGEISGSTALYGATETGEKVGAFGTVALILDDVIVSQYSLNRFQDTVILIPYSVAQTVEVFVSPTASCKVAVLDEGDRWVWSKISDPENLPEISTLMLN